MIIFEFKNIDIFFIYFNSIFDNDFIKYFKFFKPSKRFESGYGPIITRHVRCQDV